MSQVLGTPQQEAESASIATDSGGAGRQIARAASIVMLAYIVSTLIGLVRGMVVTSAFDVGAELDSFNAANRVTELLFNLMAGGALGSAFIPMFTGFLTRKDNRGAWRLASGVLNVVSIVLIIVSVLVWIGAPWLVEKGLYGLVETSDPAQIMLTVRLLRIMMPTVLIFGMSGLVMGVLNSHQVFLWPALAPAMYSLGMIFGVLFLPQAWGIQRLAIGVVIGALGHLSLQLPSLFRLKGRSYTRQAGLEDQGVRQVLKLMVPRMIGAGVVQLNFVANTVIALGLGDGPASAVSLAFALMLMPQAAIAQSAGTASLPTLSAQVELGLFDNFRQTLAGIVRVILLLALPAGLGLILLRVPLVEVLYERGNFGPDSTQMVAWALLWYAVGLVGHALVEVLSRAYYALHDTKTPVIVGVIAMALNILLSFVFAKWFSLIGWMPHGGLALANSLATFLESIALLLILRKKMNGIGGRQISRGLVASLIGTGLMAGALFLWLNLSAGGSKYVILFGGLAIGVVVYGAAMIVLRVPEVRAVLSRVKRLLLRVRK